MLEPGSRGSSCRTWYPVGSPDSALTTPGGLWPAGTETVQYGLRVAAEQVGDGLVGGPRRQGVETVEDCLEGWGLVGGCRGHVASSVPRDPVVLRCLVRGDPVSSLWDERPPVVRDNGAARCPPELRVERGPAFWLAREGFPRGRDRLSPGGPERSEGPA